MAKEDVKKQSCEDNEQQENTINTLEQENAILRKERSELQEQVNFLNTKLKDETNKVQNTNDLNAKIAKLAKENNELKKQIEQIDDLKESQLNRDNVHITTLQEKIVEKENTCKELESTNNALQDEIAALKESIKQHQKTNNNLIQLTPIAQAIAVELATKLSAKYGRKITISMILSDYMLKYNIQQYNQWFHPFVLTDKDFVKTISAIAPQLNTMNKIRAFLKLPNQE